MCTGRPATMPTARPTMPCCRSTRWRAAQWRQQKKSHILDENEIVDGIDELGVLLYGHAKNAYWYGSQLSIEETRRIAPYQNATGLQVTSAVLAGMVWALENPQGAGLSRPTNSTFAAALTCSGLTSARSRGIIRIGRRLKDRAVLFPEDIDREDPWQFKNVIVR